MASKPKPATDRPAPRLYLVAQPGADADAFAGDLHAALSAADVAAMLVQFGDFDERSAINRLKAIVPVTRKAGVALIANGRPEIVAKAGADGAHLSDIDAFLTAVEELKPQHIAGVAGLHSRHDAMLAAERGADYVMFGEPDADGHRPAFDQVIERVAWWAEVFEIPCVGFATNFDEIAPLVAAGADFVAIGDFIFNDPRGVAIAVAEAAQRMTLPETVT